MCAGRRGNKVKTKKLTGVKDAFWNKGEVGGSCLTWVASLVRVRLLKHIRWNDATSSDSFSAERQRRCSDTQGNVWGSWTNFHWICCLAWFPCLMPTLTCVSASCIHPIRITTTMCYWYPVLSADEPWAMWACDGGQWESGMGKVRGVLKETTNTARWLSLQRGS